MSTWLKVEPPGRAAGSACSCWARGLQPQTLASRFQNVLALRVPCVVVVGVCVPFSAFSGLSDAYGFWTVSARISLSGGGSVILRFHMFQLTLSILYN